MTGGTIWIFQPQLILLLLLHHTKGIQYQFLLEEEGIFNLSGVTFAMEDAGILISGNHSLVWDVQPTDRIEAAGSLRYFDRGTRQPTTLNILVKDFCKVMYDPRQLWYDFFIKHISNRPDIEKNCVRVKGTIYSMETYILDPHIGLGVPLRPGRYAVHVELAAYDQQNVKRPNFICFEMKGEFFKV